MMQLARKVRRVALAGLVAGLVAIGMAAQAGTHLLALTTPPTTPATETEALSEYSVPGPFPVGMRTLPDNSGSPGVTMWYPAAPTNESDTVTYAYGVRLFSGDTDTALATFEGRAALGAPFNESGTAFPLVILSHGFAMTPGSYGWLAEHLASHGMVVVAPDHAETLDPGGLWTATIERPQQIRAVLAGFEARTAPGAALNGFIDRTKVAVVGHSYGGYAALAAAGAELDLGSFQLSCEKARVVDDPITFLCDALEPHIAHIEASTSVAWSGFDVDAVISIAGDAAMFGETGLAKLTAPVMVIGGTADTDTPYEWGPGLTFSHAGSQRKAEVTLNGAGHLVFAGRCETVRRLLTLADLGFCSDPSWDRYVAQAVVKHYVAAFLRAELSADQQAAAMLGGNLPEFRDVDYDSEGF